MRSITAVYNTHAMLRGEVLETSLADCAQQWTTTQPFCLFLVADMFVST